MVTSTEEKIQELKRNSLKEDINLVLTREIAELLRISAIKAWGPETLVSVIVKNGDMEEWL